LLNPYKEEIEALLESQEAPSSVPAPREPACYEETPFAFVQTEQELLEAVEEIEKYAEIAVDLKHHQMRSYLGLTCLMQLSTREKDYVIDVLALFDCLGQHMQPLFANPNILKVFHGGDYDIQWL